MWFWKKAILVDGAISGTSDMSAESLNAKSRKKRKEKNKTNGGFAVFVSEGLNSKWWNTQGTVRRWKQTARVTSAENDSVSSGTAVSDLLLCALHSVKSLLWFSPFRISVKLSLAFPYHTPSTVSPPPPPHSIFQLDNPIWKWYPRMFNKEALWMTTKSTFTIVCRICGVFKV